MVLESTLLEAGLYPTSLFLVSSVVMSGLVSHLLAQRAIGNFPAVLCIACSIGKLAELLPGDSTAGVEFLSAFTLISAILLPVTFSTPLIITEKEANAFKRKAQGERHLFVGGRWCFRSSFLSYQFHLHC